MAKDKAATTSSPSPCREKLSNMLVEPVSIFLRFITIIPIKLSRQPSSFIAFGLSVLYIINASSTVNIVPLELIIEPFTPVAFDKPM